jgi:hypothetical protein
MINVIIKPYMLSDFMLNSVKPSVFMLNVMASHNKLECLSLSVTSPLV